MKSKKVFTVVTIILITIFLIILLVANSYSAPEKFRKVFGFELPKDAEILNYNVDLSPKHIFTVKISISEDDYPELNEKFVSFFDENGNFGINLIPHFENVVSWWDMDRDRTISAFCTVRPDERIDSRFIYVFFTKEANGEYFLYIDAD